MKNKVLQKASELFLRYGFKSVTMDDIASEMAISKKTIYHHFATKRKLIEAVAYYILTELKDGFNCICNQSKNPVEELFQMKSLVVNMLNSQEVSPKYQLEKYYPKIHESLKQKQFESVKECISNNLIKGIEQGYYRQDIDIDLVTRLYFTATTGLHDTDLFPQNEYPISRLIDGHLEYHIRAIATNKGISLLQKMLNK